MADSQRLTLTQWLVCIIAAIGFAFDTYELLMMPLILRPALLEMLGAAPNTAAFNLWRGLLFFVPAVVGGVFGLLGGYLTDRLGRRRVLTWSILLYAFSAFAAGYSTSIWMLLVLRCTTFIGVSVEFVAAVAWLAELFPEPKQRERVLGYTQFFSSFGGVLVATANHWIVPNAGGLFAIHLPDWLGALGPIKDSHAAWRYTLMSGLIPALPLIIVRPFLPESPSWQAKRLAGTLQRPRLGELFAPDLRRTTIVTTLMMALGYGAAFGAIQQIPQIVPAVPEVHDSVAKATKGLTGPDAGRKTGEIVQGAAARVSQVQEFGGLAGRLALALLVVIIVSRQSLIRVFIVPGLIILPIVFGYVALHSLPGLKVGIFLVGFFTVAQFSFWGNYLPRVFPLHLRGTGESFAANIGGRMIGTSFALVTSLLALKMPGETDAVKMAVAATAVGTFVYLANLVLSFWLPEPPRDLPSD
ncbi:MAG TPA: MFS transporter [Lacipirellulaceae bacterium]|jgi:MFS family permease|nr:MFS transporter [Lacipirellulaceae bacterium]